MTDDGADSPSECDPVAVTRTLEPSETRSTGTAMVLPRPSIELILGSLPRNAQAACARISTHPAVVDTCVIVRDIAYSIRAEKKTVFQEAAAIGAIRPYASHHVYAEVLRTLDDDADEFGFERARAERLYWRRYAPYIRFVDVPAIQTPEIAELAARDRTDVGTAALVQLIAPVLAFSTDSDLTDPRLALSLWVEPVGAALKGAQLDLLAGLTLLLSMSTMSRVRAHVESREGGATAKQWLIFSLAVAATLAFPTGRQAVLRGLDWTGRSLLRCGQAALKLTAIRAFALGTVAKAHVGALASTTLADIARILALSPVPLSVHEIASVMGSQGLSEEVVAVRLRSCPAFVQTNSRWQLGKTMSGFGSAYLDDARHRDDPA